MRISFNFRYFLFSFFLFLIEVLIAVVFHQIYFVRAFLGDILVVILLYTLVLSFFEIKNKIFLVLLIFCFAVLVEILQYFKLADLLGVEKESFLYIAMGNYFSWGDIICYMAGCLFLLLFIGIEKKKY